MQKFPRFGSGPSKNCPGRVLTQPIPYSSAIKSFHLHYSISYIYLFSRYIAIVRPLKPRMSKTFARVFLIVIWTSSAMVSIPALLYSRTWTFTWVEVTYIFYGTVKVVMLSGLRIKFQLFCWENIRSNHPYSEVHFLCEPEWKLIWTLWYEQTI